jgi:hypothetical protein
VKLDIILLKYKRMLYKPVDKVAGSSSNRINAGSLSPFCGDGID